MSGCNLAPSVVASQVTSYQRRSQCKMRLLNVHTLTLETYSHTKPRYAIASHRWQDGTESSFQDVEAKRNLDREGFQKITMFAQFVRDRLHDIDHLWIDTCCIDKTNSQELQEAITAMYKWYRGAAICLVYLNDVPTTYEATNQTSVECLRRSSWFTRGWTLQELLAPCLVVFLSATWDVLGHKALDNNNSFASPLDKVGPRLHSELSSITGIPELIIAQPERRKLLGVRERLRWVSTRTTTRPEDMAYCLLGLFEVSMPLIYEEGQTAAMRRLMRAIAEANEDLASDIDLGDFSEVKKPRTADTHGIRSNVQALPMSTVPFIRDPAFVDRPELRILEQKLLTSGARVVLTGLGGVGKSQLAIEYCYQLRERYPDTWVLWIHAGSQARYEESLRALASDVNIPGHEESEADIYELCYSWLRDVQNGKWLMVLDNADEADFLFEPPGGTAMESQRQQKSKFSRARLDLLPICTHGSMIVTSRYRAVASRIVDDQDIISVLPMEQDNAVTLLKLKLGHCHNLAASKRLAAALEYMPLAISQAATYIKRRSPRCSIEQYLMKLERNNESKSELLSAPSTELRRNREARNSILSTWQISFDHVRSIRQSAADLLSLMSFFDHQGIPVYLLRNRHVLQNMYEDAVAHGYYYSDDDEEALEDDIATLRDYNFISVTPCGHVLKVHNLLQLATQRWLVTEGQYQLWLKQYIRNLELNSRDAKYILSREWETLYPHARLVLDLMPTEPDVRLLRLTMLSKAAWFALRKRSIDEAYMLACNCKEGRERMLGRNHNDTLYSLQMLGILLRSQGKIEEAKDVFRLVLERQVESLESVRPVTLATARVVGTVSECLRSGEEHKEVMRYVPEEQEEMLEREHQLTLGTLASLAFSLSGHDAYEKSEQVMRYILERHERVLWPKHERTLENTDDLAAAILTPNEPSESQVMFQRASKSNDDVMSWERPTLEMGQNLTGALLHNLSFALQKQGKFDEAEHLSLQAVQRLKNVWGLEHPHTLDSLVSLVSVLVAKGDLEDSIELLRHVVQTRESIFGPEHPETLSSRRNLEALLQPQDEPAIEES